MVMRGHPLTSECWRGYITMTEITGETSDGYHTFNELYQHRTALFIALMATHPLSSWYSVQHDDGTMYDGMFIAGMNLSEQDGQITYHLEKDPWWDVMKRMHVCSLVRAPKFDGHTPEDVIDRLIRWSESL